MALLRYVISLVMVCISGLLLSWLTGEGRITSITLIAALTALCGVCELKERTTDEPD